MTGEKATQLAQLAVEEKGGSLAPEIRAWRERTWILFGRRYWVVVSNWPKKGGNWWVRVDDATGAIISMGFAPK